MSLTNMLVRQMPIPDTGLLVLFILIGLVIILAIGVLFAFPIASLAGILAFFFTGSLTLAGLAFLVVALISVAIGDSRGMSHRHHYHNDSDEEIEHVHHD